MSQLISRNKIQVRPTNKFSLMCLIRMILMTMSFKKLSMRL